MSVLLAVALLVNTLAIDEGDPPAIEPVPEEAVAEPVVPEPVLLAPRDYLYANHANARKLDCMIRGESSWDPYARSGPYLGLAQFDPPTWMETPQGRAGRVRTDPYAAIDAMAWGVVNLGYGRWPVTSRRC